VFIDLYGPGAAMLVHEGRTPRGFDAVGFAQSALGLLNRLGVRAVYVKPFPKDRAKLGGDLPASLTDPTPAAGDVLPEAVVIREVDWRLEVRLYDGFSTGLFLDQRENRAALARDVARRAANALATPVTVLNTFAYTCAFSVAAATAGAITTSVDVSGRYLDWGKRNFAHNGLDPAAHRFARMDTFEFFAYARRKGLTYDLIILDPPSFASGSKKKGVKPFSSVADYARLVHEATTVLRSGGAILASTNTQELCRPTRPGQPPRLEHEIAKGLGLTRGQRPRWLRLPGPAPDFASEQGRFAARFFTV
jgi:23S rRNA (cytosine1962-C5)-methyltransferase